MSRIRPSPAARVAPVAVVAVLVVLLAPVGLAHAVPYESEPSQGERLDEAPAEAVVRFTEPVYREGSFIEVRDVDGERVDLGDLRIEGDRTPTMRVGLPADLPDGAYRIVWQTYSRSDGHVVGGTIGFAVGGFAPPGSQTTGSDGIETGAAMARWLTYLGYAGAAGLAVMALVVRPRGVLAIRGARVRRVAVVAGALYLCGTGLLWLDTWRGTGLSAAAFLSSPGGTDLAVRGALGFLVAGLALGLHRRGAQRPLAWVLGILWLAAMVAGARFGHAATLTAWAVPIQAAHAVAVAAWVGGLFLLLGVLWSRRDTAPVAATDAGEATDAGAIEALAMARRFGSFAAVAVAVIAATGVALVLLVVEPSHWGTPALWRSPWIGFLVGKVALAAAMVAVAGLNRWGVLAGPDAAHRRRVLERLAARIVPQGDGGRRTGTLRRLVAVEAAVGLVVLALAGALMSTGAPQEGLGDEAPFERGVQGLDFTGLFQIRPAPTAGGFHEVRVFVQDEANGEPVRGNDCAPGRDDCLRLVWYAQEDGPERASEAVAVPEGDGWWRIEEVLLASPGNHTLVLEVQTAQVFLDELELSVFAVANDP